MRIIRILNILIITLWAASQCLADTIREGESLPPGIVIHNSPAVTHNYIGSPSIVIMPDGTYIASHDYFGKKLSDTYVYMSKDRGNTWTQTAHLERLTWATLFNRGNELYLIGVSPKETIGYGNFVVRKSLDYGHSWTEPKDGKSGLILNGFYHCAPVPVVKHNGKYWRAMENMGQAWGWGPFSAMMTSIPCDADLLDAGQWTFSNEIKYDASWKNGATAWLEGNAVVTRKGEVKDILRIAYKQDDVAAMTSVSPDGRTMTFNPATDYINLPGAGKKFTIRYDKKSKKYWTLSNFVLEKDRDENDNGGVRNTQVLLYSKDLKEWCVKDTILTCSDPELHGFQYVDWQFDGKDIILVSRTAWKDKSGNPPRQHDANYLTFHRISDFRSFKKPSTQLKAFQLNQVRLLPSPFNHAQQLDAKWLLSFDPDRLNPQTGMTTYYTPLVAREAGLSELSSRAGGTQEEYTLGKDKVNISFKSHKEKMIGRIFRVILAINSSISLH